MLLFFLCSQSQAAFPGGRRVSAWCSASCCPNSSWSVGAALVKCLVLGQWEALAALEQLLVQLLSDGSQYL